VLDDYLRLFADRERIEAFDRVIRQVVRSEDVVVDLGCGIGTYAIFAARAGARRVFAVESSAAIEYAREMARRNSVDVEFIAGDALDVRLPELATVLIYEDYSTGLLPGPSRALLDTIRANWMTENYRAIPERASLYAAPIASESVRRAIDPFRAGAEDAYGLDASALLDASRNTAHHFHLVDAQLLAPSTALFEQATCEPFPSRWRGTGTMEFDRAGLFDGLCLWHDLSLLGDEIYSNAPDGTATWGQHLFPVSEPWPVEPGDRLGYDLAFDGVFDEGVWKWSFELLDAPTPDRRCAGNTFAGLPVTGARLERFDHDSVVRRTPRTEIEAFILSLVDGKRTLGEIAAEVQRQTGVGELAPALDLVHRCIGPRR